MQQRGTDHSNGLYIKLHWLYFSVESTFTQLHQLTRQHLSLEVKEYLETMATQWRLWTLLPSSMTTLGLYMGISAKLARDINLSLLVDTPWWLVVIRMTDSEYWMNYHGKSVKSLFVWFRINSKLRGPIETEIWNFENGSNSVIDPTFDNTGFAVGLATYLVPDNFCTK